MARSYRHEIRDPIHVFIKLDGEERRVVDSRPFQRLRHVTQLATTYLVYPGATHKRFEHSLGVMDLASRVFDVVMQRDAVTDEVREVLTELESEDKLVYWRRVLRMAALCHDVGHLPFSHAAEEQLLPAGWNHERISVEFIRSAEMKRIWDEITPPLRSDDIAKLAVGPKYAKDLGLKFSTWEAILSEIVTSNAFGVDRIDYLLRDSHHAGVAYGRFDHNRLIDTLRILPSRPGKEENLGEPTLGIEEGGLQSAEALLLARYLMYSQMYFHAVRRIYDIHLRDFLGEWLPGGKFSVNLEDHLRMTDNEVLAAMSLAAFDPAAKGHVHAERIICRKHFRRVYERNPDDVTKSLDAVSKVDAALKAEFGEENVRKDELTAKGGLADFPVRIKDGRIVSSLALSETLRRIPDVAVGNVYVRKEQSDLATKWLEAKRATIIT